MDKEDITTLINNARQEKATKLDLSNRDIQDLPKEIGLLTELKHLNLSYNKLRHLPLEISNLTNLETLLIYRNKLTDMSPLCFLHNVKTIDISHNYITEIPEEIENLAELTTLDFSYCNIERLPFSFTKLINLKVLHTENNNFMYPPQKVIKRGIYATMYFLTQEKKKLDAKKIHVQIFNLPKEAQSAFSEYIECFNSILSPKEESKAIFKIRYINSESNEEISDKQLQDYFYNFIYYIKENISNFNGKPKTKNNTDLLGYQVRNLKDEIGLLNSSLEYKIKEIQEIQNQLIALSEKLSEK